MHLELIIVVTCTSVKHLCVYVSVLGLDYVIKDNRTRVGVPKYNNKVQKPGMFDQDTQVYLPHSMLKGRSMAGTARHTFQRVETCVFLPRQTSIILPLLKYLDSLKSH